MCINGRFHVNHCRTEHREDIWVDGMLTNNKMHFGSTVATVIYAAHGYVSEELHVMLRQLSRSYGIEVTNIYKFSFIRRSLLLIRSLLSGHRLLFPGGSGFAPPVLHNTRRGGGLTGLVSLPRPHLLPPADDGSCSVPVGGQEPPQELHPHDCVPGGVK